MIEAVLLFSIWSRGTNSRLWFLPLDPAITTSPQTEELFDLIASSQSRRLDDQRVNVSILPGLRITQNNLGHLVGEGDLQEPSDEFYNMLIKCQARPLFSTHRAAATYVSLRSNLFMTSSPPESMISGAPHPKQASRLSPCPMKTSSVSSRESRPNAWTSSVWSCPRMTRTTPSPPIQNDQGLTSFEELTWDFLGEHWRVN